MSEQEQGAANDAPPQPRTGSWPPPASADPSHPAGPPVEEVGEATADPVPTVADPVPAAGLGPQPVQEDGITQDEGGTTPGGAGDGTSTGPEPRVSERAGPDPSPAAAETEAAPAPGRALPALDGPVATLDDPDPDADPEGPHADAPQGELSADAKAALEVVTGLADMVKAQAERDHEQLAALAAAQEQLVAQAKATQDQLATLATGIAEGNRLRSRDQAHVEQLHTDNTSLRRGELTSAMAPLLSGLVRLSDQMASMAAGDKHSIAGMLRVQLLQTMDVAAGVTEFAPADGEAFDTKRMTGAGREDTTDPDQDGTVCRTVRSGFARGDGSIVRVAEVVVRRLAPTPRPAGAGSEQ